MKKFPSPSRILLFLYRTALQLCEIKSNESEMQDKNNESDLYVQLKDGILVDEELPSLETKYYCIYGQLQEESMSTSLPSTQGKAHHGIGQRASGSAMLAPWAATASPRMGLGTGISLRLSTHTQHCVRRAG